MLFLVWALMRTLAVNPSRDTAAVDEALRETAAGKAARDNLFIRKILSGRDKERGTLFEKLKEAGR